MNNEKIIYPALKYIGQAPEIEESESAQFLKLKLECVPPRFRDADIMRVSDENKGVIDWITNEREKNSLFIYGECGVGKTYAFYALYKLFLYNRKNAYAIASVDLIKELQNSFRTENTEQVSKFYSKFTGVLFIDDFGTEKPTDFVLQEYYRIINHRYENFLPMVIASNLSLDAIAERIDDRIASRIAELCDVVQMVGPDRRVEGEKEEE